MSANTSDPVDVWTLNASGLCSIAANWSNGLPATGGSVLVAPTSPVTLTFDIAGFTLGSFTLQGATLVLQAGRLIVTGGATLQSATLAGPHGMVLSGASQAHGLTLEGATVLYNFGIMTQSGGDVVFDGPSASSSAIVNAVGANWIVTDDSGVAQGTGAGGWFMNHGQFTDSATGGVALVSVNFQSYGTVSVAAGGTLEFNGPQAQLSGTFSGGGLIEYGAADVATLGALTIAATNQTNNGVVNQVGTMKLTGAQTIMNNHIWNFDGDFSMLASAGAEFFDLPNGLVAKTAGTGVSDISAIASLYGAVNVATGTLEFSGATTGFAGPVYGAGTLEIAAGAAKFAPSGQNGETISVAHLLLAGGATSVLGNVTDTGGFEGDAGATLGGTGLLTLSGNVDFAGLNLVGSGEVIVSGTATASGGTIGGNATLFDRGTVTQSGGSVTLGDAVQADAASLTLAYGGVWDILDASGLLSGVNSFLTVGNAGTEGLFEKTGAGVSVLAPVVFNNSTNVVTSGGVQYEGLEAAAGTLDVHSAVSGTGTDNIVGAATLEFDGAVQAGQTVSFFGAGGTLQINDITHFSAAIAGFDTVGSNDALLVGLNMQFTGASETATAATLNFAAGSHAFSLTLTGDYQGGTFSAQPVLGFGVKVTYQ